ncbi:MAG TPA: 2-C-methyl-D-erythritol 2,4-cyclodiphosphate synthase [Thermoanaerobaculia bacterium]|nr:2-C-methyl-D-erythritol 2,4-cyclodiphosphate synthase [Thermoanaerobaculia bacterium]
MRIGHGFDAHRLEPGRRCVLGGVAVPSDSGPIGHSDGDVVLHALADALLGAAAMGDLGTVFGTDRPEWAGAAGEAFVRHVRELTDHPAILNVDVTILAVRPRVGEYREAMRENIAALLGIPVARVSVKASSGNGLTDFGRGEGVAATVVLLAGGDAAE